MKLLRLLLSLILLPPMPLGAGRLFNGSTDIASASTQSTAIDLIGNSQMSMAGWIYMTSIPAGQSNPFGMGTQSNNTEIYYFDIGANSNPGFAGAHFFQTPSLNHNVDLQCAGTLVINTWYSLVATWSGALNRVAFYINGTNCGVTYGGGVPNGLIAASGVGQPNFCFGGFASPGIPGVCNHVNFAGTVGEVALWGVELSASQAASLAHTCPVGAAAKRAGLPQPVGYWPMYGASGSSIEPDLSGHVGSATLTGTSQANHPPCTP